MSTEATTITPDLTAIQSIVERVLDQKLAELMQHAQAAQTAADAAKQAADHAKADAAAAKQAVADIRKETTDTLSGIRTTVDAMKSTVRSWDSTINRIDSFMQQRDERLTGFEKDMERKEERLNLYGRDIDMLQREVVRGEEDRKNLRWEIHGDGDHPDRPSIMGEIRGIKTDLDDMKAALDKVEGDVRKLAEPGLTSKLWTLAVNNKVVATVVTTIILVLLAAAISLINKEAGQNIIQLMPH